MQFTDAESRQLAAIRDRLSEEVRNIDTMLAARMPPPSEELVRLSQTNFIESIKSYRNEHAGCTLMMAKLVMERARESLSPGT